MSKFLKILAVLIFIPLVEIVLIYKGYINNKNKRVPTIEEINPYNYTAYIPKNFY